jgi:hypothetical protein
MLLARKKSAFPLLLERVAGKMAGETLEIRELNRASGDGQPSQFRCAKKSERAGEVGVGDKKMKKNKLLMFLLILNIITVTCLFYTCWLISLWKMQAMLTAEYKAKYWAESMYNKKMISKLRLVLKDGPEPSVTKPTEFDGPYVIMEWYAYTSPFIGGRNSPSVKIGRTIVEAYNTQMKEMYEHPEEYKKQIEYDAKLWQKKILGKNDANKPEEVNDK